MPELMRQEVVVNGICYNVVRPEPDMVIMTQHGLTGLTAQMIFTKEFQQMRVELNSPAGSFPASDVLDGIGIARGILGKDFEPIPTHDPREPLKLTEEFKKSAEGDEP